MNRVVALVEGRTEQLFVRDVLAPYLVRKRIFLDAKVVGKPGHKGGVGHYERARRDLLVLLKQEPGTTVTMMFDYYAMPDSWPGRAEARKAAVAMRASIVESAIRDDMVARLGGSLDARRFIPYVQMHEFEAILFSEPPVVCDVLQRPKLVAQVRRIRRAFATPEEINDNAATAPSGRLHRLFHNYRKTFHGVIIARRIGIDTIRAECPHFAEWLTAIESLAGKGED